MGEIKVGVEELKNASKQFLDAATSTNTIQTDIKTASEALLNAWKGKGKDAFDHEYQIIYKNMYTYSEVLTDISKELADIAKQFADQDSSIKDELLKGQLIK